MLTSVLVIVFKDVDEAVPSTLLVNVDVLNIIDDAVVDGAVLNDEDVLKDLPDAVVVELNALSAAAPILWFLSNSTILSRFFSAAKSNGVLPLYDDDDDDNNNNNNNNNNSSSNNNNNNNINSNSCKVTLVTLWISAPHVTSSFTISNRPFCFFKDAKWRGVLSSYYLILINQYIFLLMIINLPHCLYN